MTNPLDREAVSEPDNPLGFDGIEFIEFATSKPQALGGVLETMGFRPIARHRSREVELYRQGSMNIIVNAQAADVPRTVQPVERPILSAFAVRVRDADAAFHRALDLGAWEIPVRARAMELNIPAIHGVGESLIYFVDRYDEFSIYDVLTRRPLAGSTSSGSSSTSASTAPPTGSSSTRRSSASGRCRTGFASASCRRGCCCRARAATSICS
jgi:4-hydroxyphenylpyruvate dioxygenase-like putative hemolysin